MEPWRSWVVQARSKVSSLMEKVKTHASVIHDLRVLCTSTAVIGPGNEISVLEVIFIHGTLFFSKGGAVFQRVLEQWENKPVSTRWSIYNASDGRNISVLP